MAGHVEALVRHNAPSVSNGPEAAMQASEGAALHHKMKGPGGAFQSRAGGAPADFRPLWATPVRA
jgi:hypothetical protein